MKAALPYGRGVKTVTIADDHLKAVLVSRAHTFKPSKSQTDLVIEALENPIGSPPLESLAAGKKNIVIVSSDHTRPVPSHITMPVLLKTLRAVNRDARITILVATGAHRASTDEELRSKYGDDIVDTVDIHVHDSVNDPMVDLGTLPSGGSLLVSRVAMEADLLIAEGFIEPHFFAGFSGGRKSILPGVVSYKTVLANHCAEFINSEHARTGNLENNPLHIDMLHAAAQARLAFILNVVIDGDKQVIKAFAGHREAAHDEGCRFVESLAGVKAAPADIAVTSNGGYPLDQNIYQSVKGMTAAEATLKERGVIVIAAECRDGHGGEGFYNTFARAEGPGEVMADILSRGKEETLPDQWESQVLARILLKHEVIMVTDADRRIVEDMHMHYAADLEEALEKAIEMTAETFYQVTVIPDGVSVIVK